MRLPRARFTVRRLMLVIAAVAVAIVVTEEFADGVPPRFVLRGIPARIGQLRRGMTKRQSYQILGIDRSWMAGGISARPGPINADRHRTSEIYFLRALRLVPTDQLGRAARVLPSSGAVILEYRFDRQSTPGQDEYESAQLEQALFSGDGRIIAKMPSSSPSSP
jgi:hypothetical protein